MIGAVRRIRRRPIVALAWLVAIGLGTGAAAFSVAAFSDQEPIEVPFTAGTISLGINPATALVTFDGMVPNDHVEGALTIGNSGTGPLRYAMTADATDEDGKHLGNVIQLVVERRTGCSGPVLEALYGGPIADAAFGDSQPGADPGDRPVGVDASEELCFRAWLPPDTDVLYQGAATSVMLTFWAEQASSNP